MCSWEEQWVLGGGTTWAHAKGAHSAVPGDRPQCFGTQSSQHPPSPNPGAGEGFVTSLGIPLPSRQVFWGVAGLGGPGGLGAPCRAPPVPIELGATRLSPQMAMLLKLQEAANYIESPDRETMVDPDLQSTL